MAYNRIYEIAISDPVSALSTYSYFGEFFDKLGRKIGTTSTRNSSVDANDEVRAKILTPPLQIEFSGTTSIEGSGSSSSSSELKLYNLSDKQISYFNQSPVYLSIKAGYSDTSLAMIYSGQVYDFSTDRDGSDLITVVMLKDSYEALKNIRVSKKYPPNTPIKYILLDLARIYSSVGITLGTLDLDTVNYRTPTSFVAEGYLKDILDELCDGFLLTWFVSHNQIHIMPGIRGNKGAYKSALGVIIKPENIKGTIEKKNDSNTQLSTDDSPTGGVKFTTFLNGNISADKYLDIKVDGFEGIYKISSVTHKLNYRGSEWDTEVEASYIG